MDAKTEIVELPSFTTEVAHAGSGPTLVLIQGLGTDHRAWNPIVEHLAPYVHCVAFDNRGVGKASPVGATTTIEDLADDAAALIESLGENAVHVAGVSLGGGIAMRVASRHPHLVKSLSLHSTAARPDPRLLAMLEFRGRLLEKGVAGDFLRSFVAMWAWSPEGMSLAALPEGSTEIDTLELEEYAQHLRVAQEQWMTDEELAKITAPTLITVGSEDILTTPRHAHDLYRGIRGSELVTVEDGGHAYYSENPGLFASLQLGWVLRHS
ncbi:alpha/beta fold hydrolase [Microbacterium sp.]|uniref:alpha/beta fold hydrolase n=1 Tax=Microbacterium sp. TaxID=51671 RepID=UPI002B8DFB6C|nr:alpha/beta fold hydrolase [Microbacterium sp.]HWL79153.1 alpha/beta fold hydrolase [Microbacterium sp.]